MTNRNEYMREYMRNKRAQQPPSRPARAYAALRQIITKLDGRTGSLAVELRGIAKEGLGE